VSPLEPGVLQSLVESSLDGIVVIHDRWRVVYANPAACRILRRRREEVVGHDFLEFIAEGYRQRQRHQSLLGIAGLYDTVIVWPGGQERIVTYSTELLPSPHKDQSFAILRDVTEERQARQEAQRKNRQLSALLETSQGVALTLELEPLLEQLLEKLAGVVEYLGAAIFTLEGESLELQSYRGPLPQEKLVRHWDLNLAQHSRQVIRQRSPVILSDVGADTPLAQAFRATAEAQLGYVPKIIGTWMGVPLMVRDRIIGLLAFDHQRTGAYGLEQIELAQAFAQQAAVAIENARLYDQVRRARDEAWTLAQAVTSTALEGSLENTLHTLSMAVARVSGALATAVLYGPSSGGLPWQHMASFGFPPGYEAAVVASAREGAPLPSDEAFRSGRVVIRQGLREWVLRHPQYAPLHPFERKAPWETVVCLPMRFREESVGVLVIYLPGGEPGPNEMAFLTPIADLAAIAVENARLSEIKERQVVLEERQRLARELHDSVSQALYGIALGARAAQNAAERNPQALKEPLEYVLALAEAGIAEMRALIFELRPESLQEEGLVAALARQAAAVRARYELQVEARLEEEPELSLDAKEALYRVAQEAIHNVVKHAEASRVWLTLESRPEAVLLEVQDDGKGFDPTQDFPGHLGQRSMRERSEAIGAGLTVESAPGQGTRVRVRLPLQTPKSR